LRHSHTNNLSGISGELQSIERFRKVTEPSGLASADKGTLGEEMLEKLKTFELGPTAQARGKQVDLAVNGRTRKIDFVEGDTLVEVKTTSQGLSADDLRQIQDFADFVKGGKQKLGPAGQFEVDKLQITMTSQEGALASVEDLTRLLRASDKVSVKLFDRSGRSRVFNRANVGKIREFLES
jgi:hypothetical protein